MDLKNQNLDLTRTKRIHFCPFKSIFICWAGIEYSETRLNPKTARKNSQLTTVYNSSTSCHLENVAQHRSHLSFASR